MAMTTSALIRALTRYQPSFVPQAKTPHGTYTFVIDAVESMTVPARPILRLEQVEGPEQPKGDGHSALERIAYWSARAFHNDGRLTADSSMDLDYAQDELDRAIADYTGGR